MGIFGRRTARERLRRATQESLTVPTFSAPPDCTPWVVGGLWPPELSPNNTETTTLAEYLKTDLQRIADSANDELRSIRRAELTHPARRAAEARVIDEARARAVRRVDSTIRQLRQGGQHPTARPALGNGRGPDIEDIEHTQVLPAIRDVPPPLDMQKTQIIPAIRDERAPVPVEEPGPVSDDRTAPAPVGERAPVSDDRPTPAPVEEPAPVSDDRTAPAPVEEPVPERGDDASAEIPPDERLHRLLAYVARQEPRVNWAIGDRLDGTTLLVTDLAHGWIPPGIAIPAGVRLPEPQRRSGRAAELLGATTHAATYTPADPAKWPTETSGIEASVEPLELPLVDDLDWELAVATHWREGLPRLVNTLAKAAASGDEIVEQEADLLRVHLDTVRYQVLAQYPDVDAAQLLNCMLLAATEARVASDAISANYHFAWFKKLSATPVDDPPATSPEIAPRA
ncbi:DUF5631 domain-containing protein [Mycobacterium asiaticum]|uniref:Vegetative cell wall protein n=1 Tax=Mycobacterium asiaticum TaxID=1790 RepID=A0A1A3MRD6_MYCAS|nr:DUF5631 domain-containing protein [Mycobacterium asiaticum]OBK10747.1 hypothetical protein A5636_14845 [Mycobacterium asiaticum]